MPGIIPLRRSFPDLFPCLLLPTGRCGDSEMARAGVVGGVANFKQRAEMGEVVSGDQRRLDRSVAGMPSPRRPSQPNPAARGDPFNDPGVGVPEESATIALSRRRKSLRKKEEDDSSRVGPREA